MHTQTNVKFKSFQYLMSKCQKDETCLSQTNVYVDFKVATQKTINIILSHSNVKRLSLSFRTIMV